MKRKLKSGYQAEPKNLKRFRSELNQFSKEHNSEWLSIQSKGGVREIVQHKHVLSRKQRRKEERKLKKMRKLAFKQKKPLPTKELLEAEKKAKAKLEKLKKLKEKRKKMKKLKNKRLKEKQEEEMNIRKQGLLEANKVEERTIKQLEKQLHLNKRKSKSLPLSFKSDGLDYILTAVDSDQLKNLYDAVADDSDENVPKSSWDIGSDEEEGAEDDEEVSDESGDEDESSQSSGSDIRSDDPDDPKEGFESFKGTSSTSPKSSILKHGKSHDKSQAASKSVRFEDKSVKFKEKIKTKVKEKTKMADTGQLSPDSSSASDSDMSQDDITRMSGRKTSKPKKSSKSRDKQKQKDSEGSSDDDIDWSEESSCDEAANDTELREDIYGRLRDEKGNIIDKGSLGAYVPPGKRMQLEMSNDAKKQLKLERLKKQLKGLLNRLSESTVQSISSQIEDLYRQHSRMEMTEMLAEVVMSACVAPILIPERLTMEHAMLIAILHGNVATDIGAYFIQFLARRFDSELQKADYGETKEVDNVLILLANLYNFKVVHCLLIFDILKKLVERFREKDIELLLLLLKNVGFSLRKDDPVALKELIVQIQQKASSVDTADFKDKSRVKFMIDVLLAIKNNNMRKIPNYDPTHLEHLRKVIRNYLKGGGTAEYQLRIPLVDLLRSDERGRWWVVGSAWSGRDESKTETESPMKSAEDEVSRSILELARQQRMNTDVRKTIFCVIMTSEDFVDAFEKLLQLGLKNQQEREIIHVIMELCLQEKTFNPFYAFLTQKFCEHDRRFQMTTQFSLWDKFKVLQEFNEQKVTNLSSFMSHLLATKALSLSVFKVIEFSELDKARVRFMKRVLSNVLLDQPEHVVRDVFVRIAPLPKLHLLREGLKLFMRHFLLRNAKKLDPAVGSVLEERVELAERMLSAGESKLML